MNRLKDEISQDQAAKLMKLIHLINLEHQQNCTNRIDGLHIHGETVKNIFTVH